MDPSEQLPAGPHRERQGRVLVLSMRRLADLVGFCPVYEFEDLVCELAGATLALPAGLSRLELARRAYRATRTLTGSRRLASLAARPARTPLSGTYDLFLAFFNHPHELFALSSVEGWRRRSGFAACYLGEAWGHLLPVYLLELLREFDHVFVGVRGATAPIARITGRPCSYLPMGVDAAAFCPYPRPPARAIDVCGIGRRSPVTHAALLELARREGLFYYYDTIRSSPLDGVPGQMTFRVGDHVEHRLLLASLLRRTRFFIVNRAWADEPVRAGEGDEIAGAPGELGLELARDGLDLLADAAHLLRHHREAGALRAGPRALDQRVQRQHLHLVGDLLDRLGLLAGDLIDLGGQSGDQRGNVGFILGARRIGRLFCDRCGLGAKRDGHWREFLSLCAFAGLLRIGGTQWGRV